MRRLPTANHPPLLLSLAPSYQPLRRSPWGTWNPTGASSRPGSSGRRIACRSLLTSQLSFYSARLDLFLMERCDSNRTPCRMRVQCIVSHTGNERDQVVASRVASSSREFLVVVFSGRVLEYVDGFTVDYRMQMLLDGHGWRFHALWRVQGSGARVHSS